jgi:hypothetical protein
MHEYKTNDKVWVKNLMESKFSEEPWKGPFTIVQVNDNGTVCLRMGKIIDTINIRNIKPYKE